MASSEALSATSSETFTLFLAYSLIAASRDASDLSPAIPPRAELSDLSEFAFPASMLSIPAFSVSFSITDVDSLSRDPMFMSVLLIFEFSFFASSTIFSTRLEPIAFFCSSLRPPSDEAKDSPMIFPLLMPITMSFAIVPTSLLASSALMLPKSFLKTRETMFLAAVSYVLVRLLSSSPIETLPLSSSFPTSPEYFSSANLSARSPNPSLAANPFNSPAF